MTEPSVLHAVGLSWKTFGL